MKYVNPAGAIRLCLREGIKAPSTLFDCAMATPGARPYQSGWRAEAMRLAKEKGAQSALQGLKRKAKGKSKTFKFMNMDGSTHRSVGKDVEKSLSFAASVSGWDEVVVNGRVYSLMSDESIKRAAEAIRRNRGG